jgi:hypothetical protein
MQVLIFHAHIAYRSHEKPLCIKDEGEVKTVKQLRKACRELDNNEKGQ